MLFARAKTDNQANTTKEGTIALVLENFFHQGCTDKIINTKQTLQMFHVDQNKKLNKIYNVISVVVGVVIIIIISIIFTMFRQKATILYRSETREWQNKKKFHHKKFSEKKCSPTNLRKTVCI